MSKYAVKCEQTVTFYIDVEAGSSWEAQNKAEYLHRTQQQAGYLSDESEVRGVSAVEIDNAED